MKEGITKLYSGDFNSMSQEWMSDGSVIITLLKNKESKSYQFRVKNLYKENEELLEERIIEQEVPKHIKGKMEEAKKWKKEKDKEK